jgi:futalosine hydrolase
MGLPKERILVMTAVIAEKEAVLSRLQGDSKFDVFLAGVGPAAAAANTAKVLVRTEYKLVISAGIGGGFSGKTEEGSLVVANEIVAADLGAETPEGFMSLDDLGFGFTKIPVDAGLVKTVSEVLLAANLPISTGPIITVSTVTGTAGSAQEMCRRVPGVVAEGMEGYGIAVAAENYGLPILEIRAISNLVGPRQRNTWRIKEALDVLGKAFLVFAEVL